MRRTIAPHPLKWLCKRLALELVLCAGWALAGVLLASRSPLMALLSVLPFAGAARCAWRGWLMSSAIVAELRWRALLAKLVRNSRRRRPPHEMG